MPVAVVRSNGIQIYPWETSVLNPVAITSVDFSYWRWPIDPIFQYTIQDGYITYDAANSVEFEFPKDEHLTIVSMILKWVGVNLREGELVQIANQQIQTGQ
jgi:hypothetical protein